jgi:hypothetical protein
MIIYHEEGNVQSIEFCCSDLARSILEHRFIQARPWTDHQPYFVIDRNGVQPLPINCCPFCGADICSKWVV